MDGGPRKGVCSPWFVCWDRVPGTAGVPRVRRGEYKLHAGKVTTNIGRGPEELATVTAAVKLTVTRLRPED